MDEKLAVSNSITGTRQFFWYTFVVVNIYVMSLPDLFLVIMDLKIFGLTQAMIQHPCNMCSLTFLALWH